MVLYLENKWITYSLSLCLLLNYLACIKKAITESITLNYTVFLTTGLGAAPYGSDAGRELLVHSDVTVQVKSNIKLEEP